MTAWVLFGVLMAWSAACAVAYLRGFGRRPSWVIAEIIVVVLLMWSNKVVASPQWAADNQTWPTTLWASNPTISAALQFGPVGGMLTGLIVMATNFAVKNYLTLNLGHNATIIIELSIGLAIGMAARTARRAHDELQRAAQLSAALEERERLSRQVHDGVIQVLALVAKRGHEIGGVTSGLADLASEQERALRRWLSSTTVDGDIKHDGDKAIDLRGLLRRRESDRVAMSLPGTAVTLERRVAAELDAAVGNALDNVRSHAGPDARAFVLLEDLGDSIAVSVRDDGVGIPAGRLEEAARQGRLGISKSIVGRLASLGGTAQLRTDIGEGTEWELCVPRQNGKHG
jgi:signal transduction histidine kinase